MKVNSTTGIAVGEGVAVPLQFSTGQVISADGTPIGYRQIGRGPGLIIMHGGMRASQHYLRLAEALASTHTVYIPNRRGRGFSGPPGDNYSIQKELEDLSALLQKTGARLVFGHSAGGFFALEAALNIPAETLLLGGSRSPAYLRYVLPVLAKVIAHARMIELPGLDHNAPDQNAPELVAAEIQKFFS